MLPDQIRVFSRKKSFIAFLSCKEVQIVSFQVGLDSSIVYTVEVGTASYLDPWDWIGVFEADFASLEDYVSFTYASICRLTALEKEVG